MDGETLIKIPYALNCTVEQAKLYSQFLDFKQYNPQGRITPKDYGRVKKLRVINKYWLEKLVNAGWAYKEGRAYCLRSYEYVWAALGLSKTGNHKYRKKYTKFYKIDPESLDLEKKVYIKQLIDELLKRTAANKVRQMRHRKTRSIKGCEDQEFFGVRRAAKLFGFRSPETGRKYRAKYFCVIPETKRLRRSTLRQYTEYGGAEFIFECNKISL